MSVPVEVLVGWLFAFLLVFLCVGIRAAARALVFLLSFPLVPDPFFQQHPYHLLQSTAAQQQAYAHPRTRTHTDTRYYTHTRSHTRARSYRNGALRSSVRNLDRKNEGQNREE